MKINFFGKVKILQQFRKGTMSQVPKNVIGISKDDPDQPFTEANYTAVKGTERKAKMQYNKKKASQEEVTNAWEPLADVEARMIEEMAEDLTNKGKEYTNFGPK